MRSSNPSRLPSIGGRFLVLLSLAACSPTTNDETSVDAGESDTPTVALDASTTGLVVIGSGTLEVTLELTTTAAGDAHVDVFLRTLAKDEVSDATVTLTMDGTDLAVQSFGSGIYMAGFNGEASTYALAIERGSDHVTVVGIDKLALPVPALTPDPPVVNKAATVTWSRPDAATSSAINVFRTGTGQVWPPSPQNNLDTGALTIPANAFSTSGTYKMILYRERKMSPTPNVTIRLGAMAQFQRVVI
jgi:hypothetical protein